MLTYIAQRAQIFDPTSCFRDMNQLPVWLFGHIWHLYAHYITQRVQILVRFALWCSVSEIWPNFLFGGINFLFGPFGLIWHSDMLTNVAHMRGFSKFYMSKFLFSLYDAPFPRYDPTSCLAEPTSCLGFSALFGISYAYYIAQRVQILVRFALRCSVSEIWPNFLFSESTSCLGFLAIFGIYMLTIWPRGSKFSSVSLYDAPFLR